MKTRLWGTAFLIAGVALCIFGMWQVVAPAQNRAITRLKIEYDLADIRSDFTSGPPPDVDGEFRRARADYVRTQFKIIRSAVIMNKAVASLKPNDESGTALQNDKPFTTTPNIHLLSRHLDVRPIKGTNLVEITVVDRNRMKAAQLANGVALAYLDFKSAELRERCLRGIKVLEEQLAEERTELEKNRNELTNSHGPVDPEIRMTKEAEMNERRKFIDLLEQKIEFEKTDIDLPKKGTVMIVDPAVPQTIPCGPNRPLGAVLFLCGLGLSAAGIRLLRSRPPVST